jgi:hypothetical protein
MGFKINKGKSWKKMGKSKYWKKTGDSAGKGQKDFWTDKDGSKKDFFTDKDGSKKDFFTDKGGKKKDFFEGFGKEKNWAKAGGILDDGASGVKDTWNAASKGIGNSLGGLNEGMSNMILVGALALGGLLIIPPMLSSSKSNAD